MTQRVVNVQQVVYSETQGKRAGTLEGVNEASLEHKNSVYIGNGQNVK